MPKVTLELPSWIAAKLEAKSSGRLTLEKEITEGTTINDFLMDMVVAYPGFREAVYNPDTGLPTEQVNFVLNGRLLTFQDMSQIKLTDRDTIILIPLYFGG